MEMALVIQRYCTGVCALLFLLWFSLPFSLGSRKSFPINAVLRTVCLIGALEVLYALIQLGGFLPDNYRYAHFSGSLNNPAVFGMLLSFCLPISFYFYSQAQGKGKMMWQILSMIFLVFVVLSDSRTALLSSCCGTFLVFVLMNRVSRVCVRGMRSIVSVVCIIAILIVLYLYKQDSADGRFLIWNVCKEMIADKPLWGWGFGGFDAQYMNYQAEYLSVHPKSSMLLLADDTKSPFNEFIHVAIIGGIPCALLFLCVIALTLRHVYYADLEHRAVLFGLIVVFLVWCLFGYPFDIPFVWLIILFCFLSVVTDEFRISFPKFSFTAILFAGLFILYLLVKNGIHDYRRVHLQESAMNSSKEYEQILDNYEAMYKDFSNDGPFLYNYAAMLHLYGEYERSIMVFNECSEYISDYNMMLLMGDNYQQINALDSALVYYKRAGDMIPNRFLPLYYQMEVYKEQGRSNEANAIAKRIIQKENKFKDSKTVEEIIKRANECLKN